VNVGAWKDPYVFTVHCVTANEEDMGEPFNATLATEVDILVDDTVNGGTQDITIKIYGSNDNGTTWSQLYFFLATANVWNQAAAVPANVQVKNTAILYTTENTHDMMKITAQRAGVDATEFEITVRQRTRW
jgi:hypothetical protein